MKYEKVRVAGIGFTLPGEIVSTESLEKKLEPLYERLRLPAGRLELMTGIQERRFYPSSVLPGDVSISSCNNALAATGIHPEKIGCLIHASVCRDHLEPATACRVHHEVGLSPGCQVFDLSNACLGILNGMTLIANMIELGQLQAGMVVGSESGRGLVETTVRTLNLDTSLTRQSIKDSVASLTIGSASCAILLTNQELSPNGARLVGGAVRSHSAWNSLCQSQHDVAGGDFQPLMSTDSHELMVRGVETGVATFDEFLDQTSWTRGDINRTICHQVGVAHQKMMLESLGLNPANDHTTFPWLGNTGSAALPITLADAADKGVLVTGDRIGLLGIGSGINCVMLGLEWGAVPIKGTVFSETK
jgi:3-oxoacyl-[acyl-carrier-protein] synthase-3